jgi:hypothetical protein
MAGLLRTGGARRRLAAPNQDKEINVRNVLLVGLLAVVVNANAADAWVYRSDTDKAKGTVTQYAEIDSTTALTGGLGSPVVLSIRVRRDMSKKTDDVLLVIRNAQMDCTPVNCSAMVQFGDRKPQKFALSKPRQSKQTFLLVKKPGPFLASMANAKKAMIQVGVVQRGPKDFDFDLPPLTLPDRPKK